MLALIYGESPIRMILKRSSHPPIRELKNKRPSWLARDCLSATRDSADTPGIGMTERNL